MKRRTKAIFLTALVLYASGQTTAINKTKSNELILKNNISTQTSIEEKDDCKPKQEIMFLFDHQQTPIEQRLQESPKIKKKQKK